jgi:diketogulonate reductase-like aldo/keto reductase
VIGNSFHSIGATGKGRKALDIVPIPGTKARRYLEENAAAADLQLSAAELQPLKTAGPRGQTAGPRYGERMMAMVDR